MKRFEGKTVIVTGGGTGIGEAICHRFADDGANVVIAELEADNGKGTAVDINSNGGTAMFCETDTSNSDSVRSMIACAVDRYGTIDILVNNAATFVFGKVEEVTDADWARVFGVNVIGYANCVREVLPTFRKAGGGAVVNIASVSAFIAQPEFIPYNASKGAVSQLTRCLAMDLAPDNIRVNAVCPRIDQDEGDGYAHRLARARPRAVIHRLRAKRVDESDGRAQGDCVGGGVFGFG